MFLWISFIFLEADIGTFCVLVQWNLTIDTSLSVFIQMSKN